MQFSYSLCIPFLFKKFYWFLSSIKGKHRHYHGGKWPVQSNNFFYKNNTGIMSQLIFSLLIFFAVFVAFEFKPIGYLAVFVTLVFFLLWRKVSWEMRIHGAFRVFYSNVIFLTCNILTLISCEQNRKKYIMPFNEKEKNVYIWLSHCIKNLQQVLLFSVSSYSLSRRQS